MDRAAPAPPPRPAPAREGAPAEPRAAAKTQRLHDVAAPPDPAVEQDLGAAIRGADDFRQRPQRRRDSVELAAPVVGDHERLGALVKSPTRVLAGEDTFDDHLPLPDLSD